MSPLRRSVRRGGFYSETRTRMLGHASIPVCRVLCAPSVSAVRFCSEVKHGLRSVQVNAEVATNV